jgi:hypothetical protein
MARPRVYDNVEELSQECDKYFATAAQAGERPTVTGLALYLGFASKQSLYDYEKEELFSYPIKRALLKIENALEKKLDQQAVTGVIFALKNMGWKDKTEIEQSGELGLIWKEERTYEANPKAD